MVNTMENTYSEAEVTEIQSIITGDIVPTEVEIQELDDLKKDKRMPELHLLNYLYYTNRDLYQRVLNDERVHEFYHFGFFPEIFPIVYGSLISPKIQLLEGGYSRKGAIAFITHSQNKFVIKPLQREREPAIAEIASSINVGPRQFSTLKGYLTEELLDGDLFSQLYNSAVDRTDTTTMEAIGVRMGEVLIALHEKGICFNDTILCGEFGESHTKVPVDPSMTKLFDFGMSIQITNSLENLDDQSIFDMALGYGPYCLLQGAVQTPDLIQRVANEFYNKCIGMNHQGCLDQDSIRLKNNLRIAYLQGLCEKAYNSFLQAFIETYYI